MKFTDEEIDKLLDEYPMTVARDILKERFVTKELPDELVNRIAQRATRILTGHEIYEIDDDYMDSLT